jgi:uncharacterized membrane protein YwaF
MDCGQYFSRDCTGPRFKLFSPTHLGTFLAIVLLNVWLIRFKNVPKTTRDKVGLILAIVLWMDESAWHIWKYSIGQWTIQEMLPLHLCSVLIWLTGFMLIFKVYPIYEFVYFQALAARSRPCSHQMLGFMAFHIFATSRRSSFMDYSSP